MPSPHEASTQLHRPLTAGRAMMFPFYCKASQRDVLIGGLWLLVPVMGWLLNMGHRIVVTHRLLHGQEAWPAWENYPQLMRHGVLTFAGMVLYHLPAMVVEILAWQLGSGVLHGLAALLWILATMAVPGYMTHYSYTLDAREIFNPFRAMRRVLQAGPLYWKAWGIALVAMVLSFLGLLAFGVGFLWTSVWFWQVAAYGFASAFTQRYGLGESSH
jgi:hypothetical protein